MAENKSNPCNSSSSEERISDGERLRNLKHALKSGIEKCVGSIKPRHFEQAYDAISRIQPKAVEYAHTKYQSAIQEMMKEEIEKMLEEENMAELLREMDKLKRSKTSKTAWRPSGVPAEDIPAHLIPVKLVQKEKLEKLVDHAEAQQRSQEKMLRQHQRALAQKRQELAKMMSRCDEAMQQGDIAMDLMKSTQLLDGQDDSGFLSESVSEMCNTTLTQ